MRNAIYKFAYTILVVLIILMLALLVAPESKQSAPYENEITIQKKEIWV